MNFSFNVDISVVIIVLLTLLCSVSVYYAFKFALIILRVQDTIEDSVDILEERQKTMEEILSKDVFFDSVEVRSCINEIRKSKLAIVNIANALITDGSEKMQTNLKNLEEYSSEQKRENNE